MPEIYIREVHLPRYARAEIYTRDVILYTRDVIGASNPHARRATRNAAIAHMNILDPTTGGSHEVVKWPYSDTNENGCAPKKVGPKVSAEISPRWRRDGAETHMYLAEI